MLPSELAKIPPEELQFNMLVADVAAADAKRLQDKLEEKGANYGKKR